MQDKGELCSLCSDLGRLQRQIFCPSLLTRKLVSALPLEGKSHPWETCTCADVLGALVRRICLVLENYVAGILLMPKWKRGCSEAETGHKQAVKPAWQGECGQRAAWGRGGIAEELRASASESSVLAEGVVRR